MPAPATGLEPTTKLHTNNICIKHKTRIHCATLAAKKFGTLHEFAIYLYEDSQMRNPMRNRKKISQAVFFSKQFPHSQLLRGGVLRSSIFGKIRLLWPICNLDNCSFRNCSSF